MEVTAGSHLGWFWKCSVATNRNTSVGGRWMTWDAESRTPLPPVSHHYLLLQNPIQPGRAAGDPLPGRGRLT
jgi:hypothetical protein